MEHVRSGTGEVQDEDADLSLCPTDSTTSKFEVVEKMINKKQTIDRKDLSIDRYVTKEELLAIEKELIKKRLPQILKDFSEVSERMNTPRKDQSLRETASHQSTALKEDIEPNSLKQSTLSENKNTDVKNLTKEGAGITLGSPVLDVEEKSDKESNKSTNDKYASSFESASKSDKEDTVHQEVGQTLVDEQTNPKQHTDSPVDKYTSSFESATNSEKEVPEQETSKSQVSPLKTLSHFTEHFSDENATVCSEEDLSPDPSIHQKATKSPTPETKEQISSNDEECKTKPSKTSEDTENLVKPLDAKVQPEDYNYPQMLSTIEEVTSVALSESTSLVTEAPELESSKEEKLTPDVDEIDFEHQSRGELTPDVDEIDFEDDSNLDESPNKVSDVQLASFNNKSIYLSEEEEYLNHETSNISKGNVESSMSSSQQPAPEPPAPQVPLSPFQQQFEHFVVSQTQSLESDHDQKTDDDVVDMMAEDNSLFAFEEGKLSDIDDSLQCPENTDQHFDTGKLTPEVEEIDFEKISPGRSEYHLEVKQDSGKNALKEMCDEITLDVVDSIITDAAAPAALGEIPDFTRQVKS